MRGGRILKKDPLTDTGRACNLLLKRLEAGTGAPLLYQIFSPSDFELYNCVLITKEKKFSCLKHGKRADRVKERDRDLFVSYDTFQTLITAYFLKCLPSTIRAHGNNFMVKRNDTLKKDCGWGSLTD